ncbi:SAV_915 family protein [Saccharopolyspora rosea]|uniref:SAV_915 family protein n=1 Tax=Saccharopolyspora rosea TaxID=524884 RepID=UPI0021D854BE|nr:SAV_915 family protein [Saccharopolyspora rosea]
MLGSEFSGFESEEVAATVYVPSERVGPDDQEARIELRRDGHDRLVMLAYNSLEELVACCGEAQPWIAIPRDRVSHVQSDVGAAQVLWGIELPEEFRHTHETEGEGRNS